MAVTKVSSRSFNQDTSRAKKAARRGPVFITDRGRPAHVLLTFDDYQKLVGGASSIVDLLGGPPGIENVDLELPPIPDLAQPAELP
jgi:hypothetical protein